MAAYTHWLLTAIEETTDRERLLRIQRIVKFEKEQGYEYTSDEALMNELRTAWKLKMDELNEESTDVQTAKQLGNQVD